MSAPSPASRSRNRSWLARGRLVVEILAAQHQHRRAGPVDLAADVVEERPRRARGPAGVAPERLQHVRVHRLRRAEERGEDAVILARPLRGGVEHALRGEGAAGVVERVLQRGRAGLRLAVMHHQLHRDRAPATVEPPGRAAPGRPGSRPRRRAASIAGRAQPGEGGARRIGELRRHPGAAQPERQGAAASRASSATPGRICSGRRRRARRGGASSALQRGELGLRGRGVGAGERRGDARRRRRRGSARPAPAPAARAGAPGSAAPRRARGRSRGRRGCASASAARRWRRARAAPPSRSGRPRGRWRAPPPAPARSG